MWVNEIFTQLWHILKQRKFTCAIGIVNMKTLEIKHLDLQL
jgi:hypothetical protein